MRERKPYYNREDLPTNMMGVALYEYLDNDPFDLAYYTDNVLLLKNVARKIATEVGMADDFYEWNDKVYAPAVMENFADFMEPGVGTIVALEG